MSMSVEEAKSVIARHALWYAAQELEWGDYPEVGEFDWRDIYIEAGDRADRPTVTQYDTAYALLTARAEAEA